MRKLLAIGIVMSALVAMAGGAALAVEWGEAKLWEHSSPRVDRMPWVYGNTLYYVLQYDIYMSEWDPATQTWSQPRPVPGAINTSENELNPTVVAGGKVMYFLRYNAATNYDFYRSEWDEAAGAWGEPVKIEVWSTPDQDWDIWVNEDETVAYLTTRGSYSTGRSLGGRDVWKSVKVNGEWQTPVNLGAPINSSRDEWSIFVGPDGEIYIDNNRSDSSGYDIFVAADEKSEPQNIGEPYNSPYEEREVAVTNKFFFFVSKGRPGSVGDYDLYYRVAK